MNEKGAVFLPSTMPMNQEITNSIEMLFGLLFLGFGVSTTNHASQGEDPAI